MKQRVTLKDICREASVSAATVSRVINNSPLVHDDTRQRVMEVIERLGYTPNAAARNLSRNRTDLIGLVFHQISSGFYASVLAGIDEAARQRGYHILTAFSRDTAEERDLCLTMFDATRVDGLIVLDSGLQQDTINRLKDYAHPFVLLQKDIDDPEVSTISCENRNGAYTAMKHLLDLGYRNLLILTGPSGAQDSQLRLEGCYKALDERGVSRDQVHIAIAHYSPDAAPRVLQAHIDKHGLPRAIFCFNDAMALSVIKYLRMAGHNVPEDVAIVGFDGIDCASYMGLTTVETPIEDMGKRAVDLLVKELEVADTTPHHLVLESKLVVRETCGARLAQRG